MKFDSIKQIIGAVAPTMATALGGPLAGTAATAIANALGCKTDEKSIGRALQQATPEQLTEKLNLSLKPGWRSWKSMFLLWKRQTHKMLARLFRLIGHLEYLLLLLLLFSVVIFLVLPFSLMRAVQKQLFH